MSVYLASGRLLSTTSRSLLLAIAVSLFLCSQEVDALPFSDNNFSRATSAGRDLGAAVINRNPIANFLRRQHSVLCGRVLIAEGDSWLDYPDGDITTHLEDKHWKVYSTASRGDTLASMLYDEAQLDSLFSNLMEIAILNESFSDPSHLAHTLRVLSSRTGLDYTNAEENSDSHQMLQIIQEICASIYEKYGETPPAHINRLPKAIILSAGGNDLVIDVLSLVLEHQKSGINKTNEIINDEILNGFLGRVQRMVTTHIIAIDQLCKSAFSGSNDAARPCENIPILLHGYDYVRASGEGYEIIIRVKGPWLQPTFVEKGYMEDEGNNRVIEKAIDRYNQAICNVAKKFADDGSASYVDMPVYFLDFRQEVAPTEWSDEIHPTQMAFKTLAEKVSKVVSTFHSVSFDLVYNNLPCIETRKMSN